MNLRSRFPLVGRLAKQMIRRNIRGGHRLLHFAHRAGWLEGVVWHKVNDKVGLAFPVMWEEVCLDTPELLAYEEDLLAAMGRTLQGCSGLTLIDCGAHLGVFSALLVARCPGIERVIAIEPNPKLAQLLETNIQGLPVKGQLVRSAVYNFNGAGKLVAPEYDAGMRAHYLVPDPKGPIPVTTVDSLGVRGGSCVIKIDVEGAEEEVVEGATETIRSAGHCVVAFEAQPYVAKRIGRDPSGCMRRLQQIRPFQFIFAETGETVEDIDQPLFGEQPPGEYNTWNIIACSLN